MTHILYNYAKVKDWNAIPVEETVTVVRTGVAPTSKARRDGTSYAVHGTRPMLFVPDLKAQRDELVPELAGKAFDLKAAARAIRVKKGITDIVGALIARSGPNNNGDLLTQDEVIAAIFSAGLPEVMKLPIFAAAAPITPATTEPTE